MTESVQKWLLRNRPPRVRITYDVHTGGALEKRELPFIVGIFADLSGDRPAEPPMAPLKARAMVPIDRDNFEEVMAKLAPRVNLGAVLRKPAPESGDGVATLSGELQFRSLEDFEPVQVVQRVPVLDRLYGLRGHLRTLEARSEARDPLADQLDGLFKTDADAAKRREPFKLLARPQGAGAAALQTAKLKLLLLSGLLARSDPNNEELKQADKSPRKELSQWGVAAVTVDGKADGKLDLKATTAALRALLEMLAAPDEPEQQALARQQLADLAKVSEWGDETKDEPDLRKQLRRAFGGGLKSSADDVKNLATKLLEAPSGAASDPWKAEWSDLTARLLRGLQRADDPAEPGVTAGITPRELAERKHEAANRWFANNLVLQLAGAPTVTSATTLSETDRNKLQKDVEDAKAELKTAEDKLTAADTAVAGATDANRAELTGRQTTARQERDAAKEKVTRAEQAMTNATQPAGAAGANPAAAWTQLQDLQNDWLPLTASAADASGLDALAPLGTLHTEVLAPLFAGAPPNPPPRANTAIAARVARIDADVAAQLNEVMHAPRFREVEATWRGLHYLVSRAETGEWLKLQLFNAQLDELRDDMAKAVDRDQSRIFKLIYEAEYGTFGGHPFSLLVGGYELGRSPQDIEFLRKIAEIAAAAHAPFIAAAAPSLFGLNSFQDLDRPRDLAKIFEGADAAGWREFRDIEDSRYVSLVLPHVLLRLPYGQDTVPARGIPFEEDVGKQPASERFLWGNAAYLLAERITNAFALYRWTAAIRGVEGGGLIEGLPAYTYTTGDGARALFCPTEVSITDRREKELNDLGFISLCHSKGAGKAAFFGGQTTNRPKRYITDDANANALISARLPYMLAASRFAHYIKVMMREKIGSFLTRGNVESLLNNWISQYVLLDENAMQEAKAAFPLSQANIIVTDVPGQPGAYTATVFLRPHFQLEELTTSIRLVANLPAA